MASSMSRITPIAIAGLLIAGGTVARAQSLGFDRGSVSVGGELPSWITLESMDGDASHVQRYRALREDQQELRQELRKLRAEFFRGRGAELRQIGISRLREYTDPAAYPLLLEVFEREPLEVRLAILDMLADQETPDADVTLAWIALFEDDAQFRDAALEHLTDRVDQLGEVPDRITYLVAQALQKRSNRDVAAAAKVAGNLNIVQVIPHLINAQVVQGQSGGSGSGEQGGALGWIMVGRQIAFVSDLQPIVADSAVAFDPELSVITEGVVVRALGASVVTYRTEVRTVLKGLASRAAGAIGGGRGAIDFGWDQRAWWDWYRRELKPELEDRGAAAVRSEIVNGADGRSGQPSGG